MNATPTKCDACGTVIPNEETGGLCPKCLLEEGLQPSSGDEPTLAGGDTNRPTQLPSERRFSDYELIEEIARGGMGVVYKAKQVSLGRTVALKMILSGQFASENDVRRFQHEAESAANLDHPGIVPVYETGEVEGRHFFSMKFIEGGSLADRLADFQTDERRAAELIASVARAVHHAHQRGILHRDLKPANILLDESSQPLVSDLGLAKDTRSDSDLTRTGAIVGTPAYMSPEQADAKEEITTAADIYSIGAVLYEALTGQPPHQGQTPLETLRLVTEEQAKPLHALSKNVDRTLELICLKCIERDPNKRYSSAAALADDLDSWRANEPVSVRPPSLAELIGTTLRAHLNSAVGAGLIGLLVGGMFSVYATINMSKNAFPFFNWTFPKFPSEPHPTFLIELHRLARDVPGWCETTLIVVMFAAFVFIGMLNVWLLRPKRGSHAFAISVVCGFMMTMALYASLGFLTMANSAMNEIAPDVFQLSIAVYGDADEQKQAKQALLERHPDIPNLNPKSKKWTLGNLIYARGLAGIPVGILTGIVLSSIIGFVPTILATTFASRVCEEETPKRAMLLYLELMMAISIMVSCIVFDVYIAIGGTFADMDFDARWYSHLPWFIVGCFAIYAIYSRWDWRLRLGLAVLAMAVRNAVLMG